MASCLEVSTHSVQNQWVRDRTAASRVFLAAIEVAHGDSEQALEKLPEDKKKKLVRLIMKRKGIKVYDEYKEIKNIQAKVEDVNIIIKEVKAKVELI